MLKEMDKTELEAIDQILDVVMEEGLEVECIYWALKAMQQDPKLTPAQAFALGMAEWIK
jgi:hypothetical protein